MEEKECLELIRIDWKLARKDLLLKELLWEKESGRIIWWELQKLEDIWCILGRRNNKRFKSHIDLLNQIPHLHLICLMIVLVVNKFLS